MRRGASGADPSGRALLVFAKAPEPGRVKTRMARELGDEGAARIYRELGARVVERLRGGAFRTIVYFDPPGAAEHIREWLGGDTELLSQPPGSLGDRLTRAFEWGFARARSVCVVGTDVPELHRGVVEAAFEAVEAPGGPDAFFGPAKDGGYYLLALARPAPGLFRDVAWSTERVLEQSLAKAEEEALAVEIGTPLADVDHAADVPGELLRAVGLDASGSRAGTDAGDPSATEGPGG